jgi:hypothetical protein
MNVVIRKKLTKRINPPEEDQGANPDQLWGISSHLEFAVDE